MSIQNFSSRSHWTTPLSSQLASACLKAVRRHYVERGVEAPSWAHLAELSLSTAEGEPGEHWLRYAAGDTTTWYILTGPLDEDDIVATAATFGEMLANDVLPEER